MLSYFKTGSNDTNELINEMCSSSDLYLLKARAQDSQDYSLPKGQYPDLEK